MKRYLSILIPTFNDECFQLVSQLAQQAEAAEGLVAYEIIVGDDGSDNETTIAINQRVSTLPHCRYERYNQNRGRAAIRNALAQLARYEWLLFIDSDMSILSNSFVANYLNSNSNEVIYGGYEVTGGADNNLRFCYERHTMACLTTERRRRHPYHNFHTSNFMVRRDIFLDCPLDERFRHYGYEDTVWGKTLCERNINIEHIDNPTGFLRFEDNASFVAKTEEALQTLATFSDLLKGYSPLLTVSQRLHFLGAPIRFVHRLLGGRIRHRLCEGKPSLRLFQLYKLGLYMTILKSEL